jgi:hypothetical protein
MICGFPTANLIQEDEIGWELVWSEKCIRNFSWKRSFGLVVDGKIISRKEFKEIEYGADFRIRRGISNELSCT